MHMRPDTLSGETRLFIPRGWHLVLVLGTAGAMWACIGLAMLGF